MRSLALLLAFACLAVVYAAPQDGGEESGVIIGKLPTVARQEQAFADADAVIREDPSDIDAIKAAQREAARKVTDTTQISRLAKIRKAQVANGQISPEVIDSAGVDREVERLREGAPLPEGFTIERA